MVFTAFHKSGLLPEATFALRSGPCGFQGLSVVVIPAAFFCDALHDVGDRLVYHVGRIIKAGYSPDVSIPRLFMVVMILKR